MKQMKIFLMSVAIIGMTFTSAVAQTVAEEKPFKTRFAVGASFNPEWKIVPSGSFSPSFGLTFEAQFTEHSGLELGVFDRLYRVSQRWGVPYPGYVNPEKAPMEHIVSTRLSYKFYSDIVNFSAGVNVDIGTGDSDSKWYGLYFSVSKDIPLCKGLILEPSINVNPVMEQCNVGLEYDGVYLGLGLKLKYRF